MEFIPVAVLSALIWKTVDFLKALRAGETNAVVTQLIVWSAGVAGVALVAQTDFASAVPIGEMSLANVNGWTLVVAGLSIGSTASVGFDAKKAIDGTDSARTPSLLGSETDSSKEN